MAAADYSHYLQEFQRYLPLKNLFLLHGNIYDLLPYPVYDGSGVRWKYLPLNRLLYRFFKDRHYQAVVFYDQVDGLTFQTEAERDLFRGMYKEKDPDQDTTGNAGGGAAPTTADSTPRGNQQAGGWPLTLSPPIRDFDAALNAVQQALGKNSAPLALIIDHASRLVTAPGHLSPREGQQFIKLLKCVQRASAKTMGRDLNHVLVLVCDRLTDLPAWLYLRNPLVKTLEITLPSEEERRHYFEIALPGFHPGDGCHYDENAIIDTLVDISRGLANYELECLRLISLKEGIPLNKPKGIVEHYKFGVVESAWELLQQRKGRERLDRAADILRRRVKGQEAAIAAVVDIIKRAATGLSGIHHSAAAHKPKGILFFAGPTGVGKTEMARSLAELLFGDENACIRFDMSEYAQEHSDQRLLGAPPGYIGYEEGGQLTNKIKETPFAVLLFDEIEKAHPKIMDKFLQILEDGRMTDGKGETVYFSEAVIIFTSNIGAYTDVPLGDGTIVRRPNILPYAWRCPECGQMYIKETQPAVCGCGKEGFEHIETPYEWVQKRILQAIEEHFKLTLGRPEIYNRIGNNFVVFDYIRPPVVGEIIDKILANMREELKEKQQLMLQFAPSVYDYLQKKAVCNIEQGGRGIGNFIETALVNPLARLIFDKNIVDGSLLIQDIREIRQNEQVTYELDYTNKV